MFNPFKTLSGYDNYDYEKSKLDRIEPKDNNGIGVSTTLTPDEGYETALLDAIHAHPVERYKTRASAKRGHKKWVEFAKNKNNKSVIKLGGLAGLVQSKTITLNRLKQ